MEYEDVIKSLMRSPVFQGFSQEQQCALADIAHVCQTRKDGYLVLEREKSKHLFLLIDGSASVEIALPGSSSMESVAKLQAGDVFGEFGLLGVERRSASVKSLTDTTCLQMSHEDLLNLCQQDCELGYKMMKNIAKTLADRLIMTTRDFGNAMYQMVFTGQ